MANLVAFSLLLSRRDNFFFAATYTTLRRKVPAFTGGEQLQDGMWIAPIKSARAIKGHPRHRRATAARNALGTLSEIDALPCGNEDSFEHLAIMPDHPLGGAARATRAQIGRAHART